MRRLDSPEDIALLKAYLKKSVDLGSARLGDVSPRSDVTVLMYFFWKEDLAEEKWFEFEGAMLETWRNCGLLKTVIVSNTLHQCLQQFAAKFDNVEIYSNWNNLENYVSNDDNITWSYIINIRDKT